MNLDHAEENSACIFKDRCHFTLITYLIDSVWFQSIEESKNIFYEKIDLIKPEKESEMIEDLKQRTGLPIHAVKVEKIDFLRDTASIKIFYNRED